MTQTEEDVTGWLATNPTEAEPGSYPRLMYNVNLPPVIVRDRDQENQLGDAWIPLNVVPLPDVPSVSLTPTSDSVAATPETSSFHVTITGPGVSGTWTAVADPAKTWLSVVSPTTPQAADGDVVFGVIANTGALRTADITVNGQIFTVTQTAGA